MIAEHREDKSLIEVRLQPRASRTKIEGFRDDGVLRVAVSSPPVGGASNEELIKVLAEATGVPKRSISIEAGLKSRNKRIRIEGIPPDLLEARILKAIESKRREGT